MCQLGRAFQQAVRELGILMKLFFILLGQFFAEVRVFEFVLFFGSFDFFREHDLLLGFYRSINVLFSVADEIKLLKSLLFEDSHVQRQWSLFFLAHIAFEPS